MRAPDANEIMLQVEGVCLAFGGVKALRDVSFNIRNSEIRAIIGPNGAGKTSMLNVINGFYHPDHGAITFKGRRRLRMQPFEAARGGIARTFQNVALFKGMSALDNIMAGRTLKVRRGLLWQMLRYGPALAEEVEHRQRVDGLAGDPELSALQRHLVSVEQPGNEF
jgi:branched-chain amino acid transport system ATP-binding protein